MTLNNNSNHLQYIKAKVARISTIDQKLSVNIPAHRRDWIKKIKQVPHAKFDKINKYWTIPYSKQEVRIFHQLFYNECDYKFKISPNIPEQFRTYYEQQYPHNQLIIRNDNNEKWFKVFVPKEAEAWRDFVKQIPGRTWNSYEKVWLVPYVKYSFRHLKKMFGNRLKIEMNINPNIPEHFIAIADKQPQQYKKIPKKTLNDKQQNALTALEEKMMIERMSERTIKTYKTHLKGLFIYYPKVLPSQITAEQIKQYVLHKIKTNHISERTQSQMINAFAAFYKQLLKQEQKLSLLKRPKKVKDLPNVFSKQEIERLLANIRNIKHKALIMLVYSSGLRRSEVKNLQKNDILFDRNSIFVRCSKGKKDRYVILADKAAEFLKIYLTQYNPKYWLFEGEHGGQYSETSIQSIFVQAKQKAKVNPNVTLHGLRHSFATHLVENNVPLHIVKDLLGHQSLKTTQVYLHISDKMRNNIQSPLDGLNL